MERRNMFFGIFTFVIFANTQLCYQLQVNNMTACTKNSSEIMVNTFWREVSSRCTKDPYNLMDLYKQINDGGTTGKWSSQLSTLVQKSLVESCAQVFEDVLHSNNFRYNVEIDRLAKYLLSDSLISDAVFEQFVDAVYLYTDKSELASNLFSNKNLPQVVASLLYLNSKFMTRADFDPRFTAVMAYYLRLIQHHKQFPALSLKLKQRVLKSIRNLPATLRSIYFSKVVHLLNIGHWEYFYAPREIGPNSKQRTALTWTEKKNTTDMDCDMTLEIDESGNIAFASNYDGVLRFMYLDGNDQKPYFWLSQEGHDDSRWWQVEYYEDYLAFKDAASKQLMCSDVLYDDYRRIVSLGTQSSELDVPLHCRWAVNPVLQLE